MKNLPEITNIIRGAMVRSGYTLKTLSAVTGIPYQTLRLQRFPNPGSWRFSEWGSMKRHIDFTPDELRMIEENI